MKCSKAHKQIHLFSELDDSEREELLNHMNECDACLKLAESMKFMDNVIARITKVQIEPSDRNLLTSKIMSSIKTEHQPLNYFELVLSYFEFKTVKWAMAGVSIFLAFALSIEQFRPLSINNDLSAPVIQTSSHSTVLHSKSFQDELRKYSATQRTSLINRCNDPFNITKYNVACLREKIVRFKNL